MCPERSKEKIVDPSILNSAFAETLVEIDKSISKEKKKLPFNKIKIGIESNFQFPSITQYILSQASNRSDLLTVIMQLKSDGKIGKVINEIEEITSTTKGAGGFKKDIRHLVKEAFGQEVKSEESFSVEASIYFLTVSKSIKTDFFRRKECLVFLKHFIACRSEAYRLEKDFERIFKKKLS